MSKEVCIRIWTRNTAPQEFASFATLFDDGDAAHNTIMIAHIPAAILADRIYQQCVHPGPVNQEESWYRWEGRGIFGTNGWETFPHPKCDGIILVGGWI
jgi:hypothetical protein